MPAPQFYLERVKEDLVREIGWTIANKVRDPRVPALLTVTNVQLAADTRNATVFFSVYGDGKQREGALTALNHAAPFIQKVVAQRVSIKHFPRMVFKLDDSIDRSIHIGELLKEIKDDLV